MSYLSKKNLERHYISVKEKDELINFLLQHFNLDLSEYSEASVRRRFTKILQDFKVKTASALIEKLLTLENGKDHFLSLFTVNVKGSFFLRKYQDINSSKA